MERDRHATPVPGARDPHEVGDVPPHLRQGAWQAPEERRERTEEGRRPGHVQRQRRRVEHAEEHAEREVVRCVPGHEILATERGALGHARPEGGELVGGGRGRQVPLMGRHVPRRHRPFCDGIRGVGDRAAGGPADCRRGRATDLDKQRIEVPVAQPVGPLEERDGSLGRGGRIGERGVGPLVGDVERDRPARRTSGPQVSSTGRSGRGGSPSRSTSARSQPRSNAAWCAAITRVSSGRWSSSRRRSGRTPSRVGSSARWSSVSPWMSRVTGSTAQPGWTSHS